MLSLPLPELIIFLFVLALYVAAAIVGILQLRDGGAVPRGPTLPVEFRRQR